MASVNKIILIGNCGKDPEVRYLNSGMAAANISIATSEKRKNKQTGEFDEKVTWHHVQFFDKLAEVVGKYVKKGSQIYIEGRMEYGAYKDKNGVEQKTAQVFASEMKLLGSKESAKPSEAQPKHTAGRGFDDLDDDIPF